MNQPFWELISLFYFFNAWNILSVMTPFGMFIFSRLRFVVILKYIRFNWALNCFWHLKFISFVKSRHLYKAQIDVTSKSLPNFNNDLTTWITLIVFFISSVKSSSKIFFIYFPWKFNSVYVQSRYHSSPPRCK